MSGRQHKLIRRAAQDSGRVLPKITLDRRGIMDRAMAKVSRRGFFGRALGGFAAALGLARVGAEWWRNPALPTYTTGTLFPENSDVVGCRSHGPTSTVSLGSMTEARG